MEPRFIQEYYLRASDFDRRLKLFPSSVLGLFQDAAGKHAEELGVGFDILKARELFWVIVKMRFQIVHDPNLYDQVRVETWPLPPRKVGFQREYLMFGARGELLIRGSSEWVLVHSEKRRIMRVPDIYPAIEFCADEVFSDKTTKVPLLGSDGTSMHEENKYHVVPGFTTIDMNQHVNNAKYADFALDAIDPASNEFIDSFQIDYHREVQEGAELNILVRRNNLNTTDTDNSRSVLAEGRDNNGKTMFACHISFQN